MLTNQEIFTKVVTALMQQNAKSSMARYEDPTDTRCLYRGPNGLKCGIGHLIPDDLYCPSMEGDTARDLFTNPALRDKLGISENSIELCVTLQLAHDRIEVEYWKEEFESIAKLYGLEMPDV